jgi:hypothetical protein
MKKSHKHLLSKGVETNHLLNQGPIQLSLGSVTNCGQRHAICQLLRP